MHGLRGLTRCSTPDRQVSHLSRQRRTWPLLLTLLAERHQPVNLVGLRDVQLGAFRHLGELGALVEGAAEAGLPGRRVVVAAVAQFALKLRPRLRCTGGVQSEEGVGCRVSGGVRASRTHLKNGGVLVFAKVLLPCVFPRDAEHGFGLVVPNQAGIFPAAHLQTSQKNNTHELVQTAAARPEDKTERWKPPPQDSPFQIFFRINT